MNQFEQEVVTTETTTEQRPRVSILEEMLADGRLVRGSSPSLIEKLSRGKDALERFKVRSDLMDGLYMVAIGRTRPEDWILSRDQAQNVTAMIASSGARLVAEVYEIELSNLRPLDENGMFDPVVRDMGNGVFSLRGGCDAESKANGRKQPIEMERRSDEDFTGRTVDAEGAFNFDRGKKVGSWSGDVSSSVLTGLETKAVRTLCSMSRVPLSELERAWAGTEKKTDKCRKGQGYGSSSDRGSQALSDPELKAEIEKLRAEVIRTVGGDKDAGKQLVKEITTGPNFAGFDSLDRLTKDFQVKQAWKHLKEHPKFIAANGPKVEAKAEPKPTRQPGEEG